MLLDVSFGIFAFMPIGWAFMAFVILCEAFCMSKYLTNARLNKRIYWTELLSNAVSGLTGIVTSMELNGGWWLVVWFPWVSKHEVNIHYEWFGLLVYYLVAFLLTLVIEFLVNFAFLRKFYSLVQIVKATLLVNVVTYAIGAILIFFLVL